MNDLLIEFTAECLESLSELDAALVRLARQPDDPELLAGIFRLVHTIKGTCGFLGLSRLETVAHAAEHVLGKLRDREMVATPAVITSVLQALDRIKEILDALASDPVEPVGDDSGLIAALDAIAAQQPVAAANAARVPAESPSPERAAAETTASSADRRAGVERIDETVRGASARTPAAPTLRVPVDLLERLTILVGELARTRDQLLHTGRQGSDPALEAPLQRLDQITSELQEGVMRTRMQAIGGAWSKLPRLVRDLALELDKAIELEMRGAAIELDRQILELIKDPLTHMERNAVDHGIERPAERRHQGKPGKGTIGLTACHDGGHVLIEVSDDGKGLDTRRIARQAVASGLVAATDIGAMADAAIQRLIFHPGFSTAETVTAVSGRGVGMDVVRTNIEKIGGSIEISSKEGQGSVFTIRIPRKQATVPAFSGNTRLSDDSMVMILDPDGLAAMRDAPCRDGERRSSVEGLVTAA